jgi:hypothetical protein
MLLQRRELLDDLGWRQIGIDAENQLAALRQSRRQSRRQNRQGCEELDDGTLHAVSPARLAASRLLVFSMLTSHASVVKAMNSPATRPRSRTTTRSAME